MASIEGIEVLKVALRDLTARVSDDRAATETLAADVFRSSLEDLKTYEDAAREFSFMAMGYGNLAVKLVNSYAMVQKVSPESVVAGLGRWVARLEAESG